MTTPVRSKASKEGVAEEAREGTRGLGEEAAARNAAGVIGGKFASKAKTTRSSSESSSESDYESDSESDSESESEDKIVARYITKSKLIGLITAKTIRKAIGRRTEARRKEDDLSLRQIAYIYEEETGINDFAFRVVTRNEDEVARFEVGKSEAFRELVSFYRGLERELLNTLHNYVETTIAATSVTEELCKKEVEKDLEEHIKHLVSKFRSEHPVFDFSGINLGSESDQTSRAATNGGVDTLKGESSSSEDDDRPYRAVAAKRSGTATVPGRTSHGGVDTLKGESSGSKATSTNPGTAATRPAGTSLSSGRGGGRGGGGRGGGRVGAAGPPSRLGAAHEKTG